MNEEDLKLTRYAKASHAADAVISAKDAKIARLKDVLTRVVNYNLDDYNMTLEDVKGECPLGLFTHGYWNVLLEASEATSNE